MNVSLPPELDQKRSSWNPKLVESKDAVKINNKSNSGEKKKRNSFKASTPQEKKTVSKVEQMRKRQSWNPKEMAAIDNAKKNKTLVPNKRTSSNSLASQSPKFKRYSMDSVGPRMAFTEPKKKKRNKSHSEIKTYPLKFNIQLKAIYFNDRLLSKGDMVYFTWQIDDTNGESEQMAEVTEKGKALWVNHALKCRTVIVGSITNPTSFKSKKFLFEFRGKNRNDPNSEPHKGDIVLGRMSIDLMDYMHFSEERTLEREDCIKQLQPDERLSGDYANQKVEFAVCSERGDPESEIRNDESSFATESSLDELGDLNFTPTRSEITRDKRSKYHKYLSEPNIANKMNDMDRKKSLIHSPSSKEFDDNLEMSNNTYKKLKTAYVELSTKYKHLNKTHKELLDRYSRLRDLKPQYNELFARNNSLRSSYDELQRMFEQLYKDHKVLAEEKNNLQALINIFRQRFNGELSNLSPNLLELSSFRIDEKGDVKSRLGVLSDALAKGNEALYEASSVIDKTYAELELQDNNKDQEVLERENVLLVDKHNHLADSLQKQQDLFTELENVHNILITKHITIKKKYRARKEAHSVLKNRFNALVRELDAKKTEIKELRGEPPESSESLKALYDNLAKIHNTMVEDYGKERQKIMSDYDKLSEEFNKLKDSHTKLIEEYQKTSSEKNNQPSSAIDSDKYKRLKSKHQTLREQCDKLIEQNNNLKQSYDLVSKNLDADQIQSKYATLLQEHRELYEKYEYLHKAHSAVVGELYDDLDSTKASLKKTLNENERLKERINQYEAESKTFLKSSKDIPDGSNTNLLNENSNLKEAYTKLQKDYGNVIETNDELEIKVGQLTENVTKLKMENKSFKDRHESLLIKFESLSEQNVLLKSKSEQSSKSIKSSGSRSKNGHEDSAKYTTLLEQFNAMKASYASLEIKYNQLNGTHNLLKANHYVLKAEHDLLEEKYNTVQRTSENQTKK